MSPLEKTYRKGEVIIKEGYSGRTVFVIRKGMVEVLKQVEGGEVQLTVLGPNEFFGEMSVLDPEAPKRTATVRALEETRVTVMSREEFEGYLGELSPGVRNLMQKLTRRLRETSEKLEQGTHKKSHDSLPPFEYVLTLDELELAREHSVEVMFLQKKFTAGQVLLKEGDTGYSGFIVKKGRLEVSRMAGGRKVVLGELGEGDIVGESALLDDTRRSATVRALTDGEMLVFGKRDIINMTRKSPLELFMVLDALTVKITRTNELYCKVLLERDSLSAERERLNAELSTARAELEQARREAVALRERQTQAQQPPQSN
ncbi:cyclic nucleotide-binding domain-containing protein [bacterium]|nr:cyclic nucleotide-binding domain-containing protein [bacterium]